MAFYQNESMIQEERSLQGGVDLLLGNLFFFFFGLLLPFDTWTRDYGTLWWRILIVVILILLFRRLPAVLLFYKLTPGINNIYDSILVGFLGPMGVAAVFYAIVAYNEDERNRMTFDIILMVVFSSIIFHGITAVPLIILTRNRFYWKDKEQLEYVRKVEQRKEEEKAMESLKDEMRKRRKDNREENPKDDNEDIELKRMNHNDNENLSYRHNEFSGVGAASIIDKQRQQQQEKEVKEI